VSFDNYVFRFDFGGRFFYTRPPYSRVLTSFGKRFPFRFQTSRSRRFVRKTFYYRFFDHTGAVYRPASSTRQTVRSDQSPGIALACSFCFAVFHRKFRPNLWSYCAGAYYRISRTTKMCRATKPAANTLRRHQFVQNASKNRSDRFIRK